MGNVFKKLKGKKNVRFVLVGLDGAGKTTILYQLKLGELVHTIPTIGFNVESMKYKNIELQAWDAGGQEVFRSMWKHYCQDCDGLMFVVDSADTDRLKEAKEELGKLIDDETMLGSVVLVIANKQDVQGAVNPVELEIRLGLDKAKQVHRVQSASATTGDGLLEGLDWLVEEIKKKKS